MLSKNVMYYGANQALPAQRILRAGPLTMTYENGDLRYIRIGIYEIIRRIYVATRDHNWGTVPNVLSKVRMDVESDHFQIRYTVDNRQGDINFGWAAIITGDAHGAITFSMEGESRSTFRRNRIGFCVLHPIRECGGTLCRIEHADGTAEETHFPKQVAPQIFVNGQPTPHGSFHSMKAMSYPVFPHLWAELRFEGDLFELEDQRNWTDGSYKTYCTPIQLPFPVEIQKGAKISQSVQFSLQGTLPQTSSLNEQTPIEIQVHDDIASQPIPPIGLSVASHSQPLTPSEVERLRVLNLSHLRIELDLSRPNVAIQLHQGVEQSQALDIPLEVALIVSDAAEAELNALLAILNELTPRVAAWLIFHRNEMVTSERWIRLAREYLSKYDSTVPLGSGSKAYFADLNRAWPNSDLIDFVTFTANPQVHATDNNSIIETAAAFPSLIQTASQILGGKPVALSPLTLKARFNPVAIDSNSKSKPDELPVQVDPRQMSLFTAGWTLACLKYLIETGNLKHLSLFETSGWLGVMETGSGSPLPDKFLSLPGCVYPLYHVLADIGVMRGGQVIAAQSNTPLKVEALLLHKANHARLLLANLDSEIQRVQVKGLMGEVTVRELDEYSFEVASCSPETYRTRDNSSSSASNDSFEITLRPYAYLCLDVTN